MFRKPSWSLSLALILGIGAVPARCHAGNPAFIPGDAFFHAVLTQEFVDDLPAKEGEVMFSYVGPPGEPELCGYAGFSHLAIRRWTPELTQALQQVYRQLRRLYPKLVMIRVDDRGVRHETETNGFDLFIYNRDVDWSKQRIGLKYNEHWHDFPVKMSAEERAKQWRGVAHVYRSFVPGANAVVEDWQQSSRFAGLNAQIPKDEDWGVKGPEIVVPVACDAGAIQIVVLQGKIDSYYEQTVEFPFICITKGKVRELSWSDKRENGEAVDKRLIQRAWKAN